MSRVALPPRNPKDAKVGWVWANETQIKQNATAHWLGSTQKSHSNNFGMGKKLAEGFQSLARISPRTLSSSIVGPASAQALPESWGLPEKKSLLGQRLPKTKRGQAKHPDQPGQRTCLCPRCRATCPKFQRQESQQLPTPIHYHLKKPSLTHWPCLDRPI